MYEWEKNKQKKMNQKQQQTNRGKKTKPKYLVLFNASISWVRTFLYVYLFSSLGFPEVSPEKKSAENKTEKIDKRNGKKTQEINSEQWNKWKEMFVTFSLIFFCIQNFFPCRIYWRKKTHTDTQDMKQRVSFYFPYIYRFLSTVFVVWLGKYSHCLEIWTNFTMQTKRVRVAFCVSNENHAHSWPEVWNV